MVEQESQTLPSLPWIAPSFFPEVLLWACIVNHELVSLGVEGSAGNFSAASGLHPCWRENRTLHWLHSGSYQYTREHLLSYKNRQADWIRMEIQCLRHRRRWASFPKPTCPRPGYLSGVFLSFPCFLDLLDLLHSCFLHTNSTAHSVDPSDSKACMAALYTEMSAQSHRQK